MRRRHGWILGLVGVLGLGCGGRPVPPAPLPLDLPVVGTVGDPPPAAQRVRIQITREGFLRVPGRDTPLSLRELEAWLVARSADPATREADGASSLAALLEIDASTPWIVVQWILQGCAHPSVKIWKIALAARTGGGAVGALSVNLPKDGCGSGLEPGPPTHRLKVFQRDDPGGPTGMRTLAAELRRLQEAGGNDPEAVYEIVAPPPKGGRVPYGTIVQMLDACLSVGARFVLFDGASLPVAEEIQPDPAALAAYLRTLRARGGVAQIRIGRSKVLLGPDLEGPGPAPGRGRVAGRWGASEGPLPRGLPLEERTEEGGRLDGPFGQRGLPAAQEDAQRAYAEQAAVRAEGGLAWLAAHQAGDGGWKAATFHAWCDGTQRRTSGPRTDLGEAAYDVGVSGLALQAFLAAGYTHRGPHRFAKVIARGLRYLKNQQDPEGCFGPRASQRYIYNHAMASLAMVESYGMTGSPIFKGSAQRALDFGALARNPYFGWRYGIKPGDNDSCVTSWMSLVFQVAAWINDDARERGKSAPLTIDDAAWDGAQAWFAKATDPDTGRVGYDARGTGPSREPGRTAAFPASASASLTAAVCTLRLYRGEDPAALESLRKGLALVATLPPVVQEASGRGELQSWHWGTLAMVRAGGPAWAAWRQALLAAAVATQRTDGETCDLKGSWDPVGPWGPEGGRVASTALMTLCLCAHHRY